MSQYVVYILKSIKDKWLYTGYTKCIKNRLELHNAGRVKSTHAHVPLQLLYFEVFENRSDAMRREKFLKSGRGRIVRNEILKKMFIDNNGV